MEAVAKVLIAMVALGGVTTVLLAILNTPTRTSKPGTAPVRDANRVGVPVSDGVVQVSGSAFLSGYDSVSKSAIESIELWNNPSRMAVKCQLPHGTSVEILEVEERDGQKLLYVRSGTCAGWAELARVTAERPSPSPEQRRRAEAAMAAARTKPSPGPQYRRGVTMENYLRLKDGMSYEQVCEILGSYGEELSRSSFGGLTTVMYQWSGSGFANMNAMFQNGRLVSKAQFGLR